MIKVHRDNGDEFFVNIDSIQSVCWGKDRYDKTVIYFSDNDAIDCIIETPEQIYDLIEYARKWRYDMLADALRYRG